MSLFYNRFGWLLAWIPTGEPQISNPSPLSQGPVLKSYYFKVCHSLLLWSTSIVVISIVLRYSCSAGLSKAIVFAGCMCSRERVWQNISIITGYQPCIFHRTKISQWLLMDQSVLYGICNSIFTFENASAFWNEHPWPPQLCKCNLFGAAQPQKE